MSAALQLVIVGAVVLVALAYLARRAIRSARDRDAACNCGCTPVVPKRP
jgi:hypothetical protein